MFRRSLRLAIAFGVSALVLAFGTASGAVPSGGAANESAQAWFVQFSGAPAARGGSKSKLASERQAFFANAAALGLDVKQRYSFDDLWNGVSVGVPAEQAGALASIPGVTAVYPVFPASIAEKADPSDGELPLGPGEPVPDLAFATTMTQARAANEAGYTGRDVRVAVIDSGIDYTNPDLGDGFGPGHRVAGGWDFVGDDFDATTTSPLYDPVPRPDSDPKDCDPVKAEGRDASSASAGHGTHVSGIVGAKAAGAGGVTGVAPDVTFLAYRVFGCNGATTTDIMAAAMERAYADGAQVVNMSIGSAFSNWPEYPSAVVADTLVDKGVVVVASIGNSGANGLYAAGAPGVGRKVIGVASVQNLALPALTFDVTSGSTVRQVPYLQLQTTQTAPTTGTSGDGTIVYVGRGCVADASLGLPVDDPYPADPDGKIALIKRGVCTFATKYHRAVAAGARAVIVMNDGTTSGRVGLFAGGGAADEGVPGVTISFTDGEALRTMATPSLAWTNVRITVADPSAGLISDFSSWGLDAHTALKPDISAPGGNITSTWPMTQFGGHNTISGTSMAAPHVAGAVALLLQAGVAPATVRDALQNSAMPVPSTLGVTDATARQGAGLVEILDAIRAPVRVSPGKISLGEGNGGAATLTLTNSTGAPITYALGHTTALAVGPGAGSQLPFTFTPMAAAPAVTFSRAGAPVASITVPANGSAAVDVAIVPPAYPEKTIWGGYVRFVQGGVTKLRVPYAGFKGDYQGITALGSGGCALPTLARIGGATDQITCPAPAPPLKGLVGQPDGGIWAQPKKDPVVLLFHLDHQARAEQVTLLDAATGQPVTEGNRNPVLDLNQYTPRNSGPNSFFAFVWDGTIAFTDNGGGKVHRKAAPAGTYKLRLTITKAQALNDTRAAGTEIWTSPAFSLRSP
jgi:minor extracellular serine protease Vpr